jgi:hypothetical protein
MRVLNRTAITITGGEPYVEWTRQRDADFNRGALTVVRTRPYGASFLLPEFELEEDLQEWIEDNYSWLFEFQLSAWTEDEEAWPPGRDLPMFRRWFRIDIQNIVVDIGDDDIEGEQL